MSIDEFQAAISRLSPEEVNRLWHWSGEFQADRRDRPIEADILAGRLDSAGQRAVEDFEAGRCAPLSRATSTCPASGSNDQFFAKIHE